MSRVLDTRFTSTSGSGKGPGRVLRQRTWREGAWCDYAGAGAGVYVDFGDVVNQARVAAMRLPVMREVVEELSIPGANSAGAIQTHISSDFAWRRSVIRGDVVATGSGLIIACDEEGGLVVALEARTGEER